jgi:hypothetical protein
VRAWGVVSGEGVGPGEAKMSERAEQEIAHDAAVIDDLLELSCGGGASQTLSRVLNLDRSLRGTRVLRDRRELGSLDMWEECQEHQRVVPIPATHQYHIVEGGRLQYFHDGLRGVFR